MNKALLRTLVDSDNYKVKIQAVVALSSARHSSFGGHAGIKDVLAVCKSLCEGVCIEKEDEGRRGELSHIILLEKKVSLDIPSVAALGIAY